ncbi:MAG: co-chaperone GroES [Candidatus Margulisiibacteriota bacterium]
MSKLNLKPLGDRVIIAPESAEQKTKSGIVLPDSAQEKPQSGTVLAVGPGKTSDEGKVIPLHVKAGDVVIYAKYGGTEIKIDGNEYLIVRESDILAVKTK